MSYLPRGSRHDRASKAARRQILIREKGVWLPRKQQADLLERLAERWHIRMTSGKVLIITLTLQYEGLFPTIRYMWTHRIEEDN